MSGLGGMLVDYIQHVSEHHSRLTSVLNNMFGVMIASIQYQEYSEQSRDADHLCDTNHVLILINRKSI